MSVRDSRWAEAVADVYNLWGGFAPARSTADPYLREGHDSFGRGGIFSMVGPEDSTTNDIGAVFSEHLAIAYIIDK